ncbi:MAG: aldehyde ferredoxin oxidoreductase family protein [Candidatus Hodarchaeota archaeon]
MSKGFFGKILWIDLDNCSFKEEQLGQEMYREYFGGYGLACRLIYKYLPPKTDPLSPKSILGFFPGLLTGTITPLSGRYMTAAKSPLTGTWGDANSGGYFGPEIKKCGYDGILIVGAFDTPKYISIINDQKEIVDANGIWGLDTVETDKKLKERHGNVQISCIGLAGEKKSLISGIVTDKGRIAARCGLGAVMGAKRLKAIVLKGNIKVPVANREALISITKKYNEGINNSGPGTMTVYKTLGTIGLTEASTQSGDAPIKNWGGNTNEDFPIDRVRKIGGIELNKYKIREYGCFSCAVQCGGIVKVPELNLEESHIPEYETCASLGGLLLNDDKLSLFQMNDLCNRAGIDTISIGGTIAFTIECYENGIINKNQTDGLELNWGNSKAIVELTKKIIKREGFGNLLADGCYKASKRLGKESENFAIHSMGQELGMHDSKFFKSLGMSYAFDPTPGKHTNPSIDIMAIGPLIKPNGLINGLSLPKRWKRAGTEDRATAQKIVVGLKQATNALGLCEFLNLYQEYPLKEVISSVVGWDLSIEEIFEVGYRIHTLRQAFTIREGIVMANNTLPGRVIGDPPFELGPHKRKTVNFKEDYQNFCNAIGWNPNNGYPLKETLKSLNLEFVIKDLY